MRDLKQFLAKVFTVMLVNVLALVATPFVAVICLLMALAATVRRFYINEA